MFFAERAILVELQSVRSVLFVFVNVVIALFAFGACKRNSGSDSFCHFICLPVLLSPLSGEIYFFQHKITPLGRDAKLFYTITVLLSTLFTPFLQKSDKNILYL